MSLATIEAPVPPPDPRRTSRSAGQSSRGATGVTRLPGARSGVVPLAAVQGTLALELDDYPALPLSRELRLVTGAPPALRPWVARFAQGVVEVISGDRGPQQLVRCVTRSVHADLVERCATLNAVAPVDQRRHRLRPQVRSVHVQQPSGDSAEVSVHVRHGERSRAIAARIELIEDRWWCVALEFG